MIGVIADDLSGAAELGAVGLRHGLRSAVVMDGRVSGDAELFCVDTDSRNCDAAEAEARARTAAQALKEAGAQWIYKKVDSVLRGPVLAEVRGTMAALNLQRALLVPANPSLGRVIRGGNYFVRGALLHETEFARDPHHPRTSARVADLLREAGKPETPVCTLDQVLPTSGVVVGEAATAADLRAWASRVSAEMLPVGAAEFFGALLNAKGWTSVRAALSDANESARTVAPGELFVCGSASESSQKFIEAARQNGAEFISLLLGGAELNPQIMTELAARAARWLAEDRRVILSIGSPLIPGPGMGRLLAGHLVRLAAVVLERATVGRVYAEGGETAALLARRMGWGRLIVVREWAPGVVTTAIEGANLQFTLKPGSYAWPREITGL